MSTPEGAVKAKIDKVLKKHGVYIFKPVQAGYGKQGLDYHCIFMGRAFCIEAKRPGAKPTPRQQLTMQEIVQAGGEVFVIDGDISELEGWLVGMEQVEEVLKSL